MAVTAGAVEKVFIVDDETDVRESLARLLRSEGLAVETFGSAQEFLDQAPEQRSGCLVLDVHMPGLSGPELHDILLERGIGLPVIYLTGRSNIATGVRAMKQGARDFLEKPVDADDLLVVVRQALQASRTAAGERKVIDDIRGRLAALSVREREVMEHVVRGRLNKQIAGDLGIAEKTVKVHRGRVMAKMKVRSVAELVHLCEQLAAADRGKPVPF